MPSSNGRVPKGDRLVGRFLESALRKKAKQIVKKKTDVSNVFDAEAEAALPKFAKTELELGRVLGKGGFCVVSEILQFNLTGDFGDTMEGSKSVCVHDDEEDEHGELKYDGGMVVQNRAFMNRRCLRKDVHPRYAIKILSDDVLQEPDRFIGGIIDLSVEARFLSVVRHPNIIKMRGMSSGKHLDRDFFVVLDRLYDILTTRIIQWKRQVAKTKGFRFFMDLKGKKKKKVWTDRILVLYDLSSAMEYLHRHRIMYRDLKPDNVGFDVRGDVKIFDFGLARELPPQKKMVEDDLYKMSGRTGSLRYMAPEVAMEKPYNETADVYSLAILAWQILSLNTPFVGYSVAMHNDSVIRKGQRPRLDGHWGERLEKLLQQSWSSNISDRPSMTHFASVMRQEVDDLHSDTNELSNIDDSNRTTNST